MGRDAMPSHPFCLKGDRKPESLLQAFSGIGAHSQVPGLGPQVSGTGNRAQVQVPGIRSRLQIPYPYPNLNTRTWIPTAETRDQKMRPAARHLRPPPATRKLYPLCSTKPLGLRASSVSLLRPTGQLINRSTHSSSRHASRAQINPASSAI